VRRNQKRGTAVADRAPSKKQPGAGLRKEQEPLTAGHQVVLAGVRSRTYRIMPQTLKILVMNNKAGIIKSTLLGGVFFLVPVAIFIWIIVKVLKFLQQLMQPILLSLSNTVLADMVVLQRLIAVVVLLLICLGAGMLAQTQMAKQFLNWLEDTVLGLVPGYKVLSTMGKNMSGIDAQDHPVVLARVDDGWQLSFLIDQISEDLYTVFVPGSPQPWSGSVYHMEKNKIIWTDLTKKQAIGCLQQIGIGSADMLKGKFDVTGSLQSR
jgi:uncharacterized membrane protein